MCSASGISTQTSASFAVARLRADSRSSQESGVHDDCPLCLPDAPEMLRTIISGGQTGADRAALDFVNQADLEQGGCPGNYWEDRNAPDDMLEYLRFKGSV